MDGLECSEIYLSTLERTHRIDAEFYQKVNLQILSNLGRKKLQPFTDSFFVSDGNHMSISDNFCDKGIPYYRGQDIHNVFIDESSPVYIDKKTFNNSYMTRSHLKYGDVLLSIVGTVGESSIVYSSAEATCSCKLAIIRSKHKDINPETLMIFIKTEYGQNQIQKFKRGAVQTGLLLEDFDQLFVPVFSTYFQEKIKEIIQSAHKTLTYGKESYDVAQSLLINELNIDFSTISSKGTTVKSLSKSFGSTGRLDAEYYQPKYKDIYVSLKTTKTVGSLCHIYDTNFIPKFNMEYRYIELANVGNNGVISNVKTICGKYLPSRARRKVKCGQVIISSVEGSLKSCSIINNENNGALCSTGFYVLDSDSINSETLLVLFQSEPIQALLKQRCSGTILTAISKDEFLNVPLPVISDNVQRKISEKVQESFSLRRQAENLIQTAIKAVEIAIESDEAAALKWIESSICTDFLDF